MPEDVSGPVAVINIEPIGRINAYVSAFNIANAVLYTTPSDKDFYLTNATIAVIKDVNSTSTNSYMQVVINGVNQIILSIPGITLTAQSNTLSQSFRYPLKLDRGTQVIVTGTTTTANIRTNATLQGYTEEVTAN